GFNPDPNTWHQSGANRVLPINEEIIVIERSRGGAGRSGMGDYHVVQVDMQGNQTMHGSFSSPGEAIREGVRQRDLVTPSPTVRRTGGIDPSMPAGGVRRNVPEAEGTPIRPDQQPAPVDQDGITAPLDDPDAARLRNAQQLT